MPELLPCQALLGATKGDAVIALLEAATGELCPCKQGEPCPLMRMPRLEEPLLKAV